MLLVEGVDHGPAVLAALAEPQYDAALAVAIGGESAVYAKLVEALAATGAEETRQA